MARKHYKKPRAAGRRGKQYHPRSRNRNKATEISKARSMQSSWRVATNRTATLKLEEARDIIAAPPHCVYCGELIPFTDLSIDHIIPRSRAGACSPENLVWVDKTCNQLKGDLTGDEFIALLHFLEDHPRMKQSIFDRLRMASAMFRRRRRR